MGAKCALRSGTLLFRFLVKQILLVISLAVAVQGLQAEEKSAIVTATALKVRATPSLKGEVVITLPRGTVVTVESYSAERIIVDGNMSTWAKIQSSDSKSGWVFGGFIANAYQYLDQSKNLVAWINARVPEKGAAECEVSLFDAGKKKLTRIPVLSETCDKFGFSQDLKYLAVDDGTYVYANLHMYRVQDKKLLNTRQYSPREINWQGSTLRFTEVLCDKDGDLKTEDNAFVNGKFQKSLDAKRKDLCAEN